MRIATATEPGDPEQASEDWILAQPDMVIALDGATARTETGCRHGIAWFAATLGAKIAQHASDNTLSLKTVLRKAIADTADQHRECDLRHVGTPSAAVAIVRLNNHALEYVVLGDLTIVLETSARLSVITDDRVDRTAIEERIEAARLPFGTSEKRAALLRMKRAELAMRNHPGGFWVAAADPTAADHALANVLPKQGVRRFAVLTDGAARAVALFHLLKWHELLELLEKDGPQTLIGRVRAAEKSDPLGDRWPRNKPSDDASVIYVETS